MFVLMVCVDGSIVFDVRWILLIADDMMMFDVLYLYEIKSYTNYRKVINLNSPSQPDSLHLSPIPTLSTDNLCLCLS